MKFRKKPVIIDAIQWTGNNFKEIQDFCRAGFILSGDQLKIKTLEGIMTASKGDWIIQGVTKEYYPCKPDVFKETYEPVKEVL